MTDKKLSKKQQLAFDLIYARIQKTGQSPTLEELATKLDMFKANVHRTLVALEEKGLIKRERYEHRGISLTVEGLK